MASRQIEMEIRQPSDASVDFADFRDLIALNKNSEHRSVVEQSLVQLSSLDLVVSRDLLQSAYL